MILDELANQSKIMKILWRDDVGGRIAQAYKDLANTIQIFDVYRVLYN
jgi:hypothetical protein